MPFTEAQLSLYAETTIGRYEAYWKVAAVRPYAYFPLQVDAPRQAPHMDETARVLRSAMVGTALLIALVLSGAALVWSLFW